MTFSTAFNIAMGDGVGSQLEISSKIRSVSRVLSAIVACVLEADIMNRNKISTRGVVAGGAGGAMAHPRIQIVGFFGNFKVSSENR